MGNDPSREDSEAQFSANPIDEVQILDGHNGKIVWCLVKIDHSRIASGADDGLVIIWDFNTGKLLFPMKHHTQKVNCLLAISTPENKKLLVSGSADHTVCVWDIDRGTILHVLNGHSQSVTCLCAIKNQPGVFCSGGNERAIFMWNAETGQNLGQISRNDEENLNCMISLSNGTLVTGSSLHVIYVYNTTTLKYESLLPVLHREDVQCLVNINDTMFASGSLDGSIIVYRTDSSSLIQLLPPKPENYKNNAKNSLSVRKLVPIGKGYLAAAIGTGFKVFHIESKRVVMESVSQSTVAGIIPLYKSSRLVSCLEDGSVNFCGAVRHKTSLPRVCRPPPKQQSLPKIPAPSTQTTGPKLNGLFHRTDKIDSCTIGVMSVHSGAVCQIVALSEHSFATCGKEGYVILWKDGRVFEEVLNTNAAVDLKNQRDACLNEK